MRPSVTFPMPVPKNRFRRGPFRKWDCFFIERIHAGRLFRELLARLITSSSFPSQCLSFERASSPPLPSFRPSGVYLRTQEPCPKPPQFKTGRVQFELTCCTVPFRTLRKLFFPDVDWDTDLYLLPLPASLDSFVRVGFLKFCVPPYGGDQPFFSVRFLLHTGSSVFLFFLVREVLFGAVRTPFSFLCMLPGWVFSVSLSPALFDLRWNFMPSSRLAPQRQEAVIS